jgi:hypothetical protein
MFTWMRPLERHPLRSRTHHGESEMSFSMHSRCGKRSQGLIWTVPTSWMMLTLQTINEYACYLNSCGPMAKRTTAFMPNLLTRLHLCCGLAMFQNHLRERIRSLVWTAVLLSLLAILGVKAFLRQTMQLGRKNCYRLCGCAVCVGSTALGNTQTISGRASPAS